MLDIAIVDDRQRLTISRTQQKDQAAIGPRLNAVFVLDHPARLIPRPGDDVGLHANREHPMADAFHGPPVVIAVFAIAGCIKIQSPALDGLTRQRLSEGLFLDVDTVRHREHVLDSGVVDKQHRIPCFGLGGHAKAGAISSAKRCICSLTMACGLRPTLK